jgi:hypothetical protein
MKKRNLIAVSLCVTALLLNPSLLQNSAQAEKEFSACDSALLQAANTISTGRDVRITNLYYRGLDQEYSDYPANRPIDAIFLMQGRSVADVMNSSQFMNILATRIINGCGSIGRVTFGMDNSDWLYSYGLVNSQVIAFTCIGPGTTNRSLRWGERYC